MTILLSIGMLGAIAVGIGLMIRWQRGNRRQRRLEEAFQRAQEVRQSGSGLQGTPYSLYGETSWSGHTRRNR